MKWAIVAVLLVCPVCPAWGQEISVFTGIIQQVDTRDRSQTGQLEYRDSLDRHFGWSLSYLNEGHFQNHRRDGGVGQVWIRTDALDHRLSFAAGLGPYYHFDTTTHGSESDFLNDHGWGALASISATWYTQHRWLFHLRANRVEASGDIDTFSVVLGVGYQLGPDRSVGPPKVQADCEKATDNELTIFIGRAILNSFDADHAIAASAEYRRSLGKYVDWTLSWLSEGHNSKIIRNGITTQLWAVKAFFDDALALGAGAGAYRAIDLDTKDGRDSDLFSGIISFTGSYRVSGPWNVRLTFNRIITNYNKDADVILAGIGYRF